jgi:tRNA 5-methylaminomethyl-2-thiouridine biosynthesis bifunctional protein
LENNQYLNHLKTRWHNAARFVILDACISAEWNFLSAWAGWRTDSARPRQLHIIAIADSVQAWQDFLQSGDHPQEWQAPKEQLRACLPPLAAGFHRVLLEEEKIVLTLAIGPVRQMMPQLVARIDCFMLDALTIQRLPKKIARLAADHATLYCREFDDSARQELVQAGFVFNDNNLSAHFAPRWQRSTQSKTLERKAIVIGAGLAGSALCERLAARDWHITLIERHAQPAQEASGNLAGIYMPLLSKDDNPTARLTRAAYFFAMQMWQRLGGIGVAFPGEACGVLQLARDAQHEANQQETIARAGFQNSFVQWMSADTAAHFLGQAVPNGGLYFPQAGWAHPAGVCKALLERCAGNVETRFARSAIQLEYADGLWTARDENGTSIAQAPIFILANGADAVRLEQAKHLPLTSIRGQVTCVAAKSLPTLPAVVCRDGYITRPSDGWCSIGASYDMETDSTPRRSSDEENCARIQSMLPDLQLNLDKATYQNRVAFRCVSPDRLPLVGALPNAQAGFNGDRLRDVPRLPGMYGLLGYASRGLIWSSFAAELLAAQLEGEPLPIESELVDALDPTRFYLKEQRRGIV